MDISPLTLIGQLISLALILAVIVNFAAKHPVSWLTGGA